jgi:hypothetical protein
VGADSVIRVGFEGLYGLDLRALICARCFCPSKCVFSTCKHVLRVQVLRVLLVML